MASYGLKYDSRVCRTDQQYTIPSWNRWKENILSSQISSWRSWKLSMNSKILQMNFWDISFFRLLILQVAHSSGNSALKTLHVAMVEMAFKTTMIQPSYGSLRETSIFKGWQWYLEKRGSWKILARYWNLGNVFDKSWSLVSAWFVFTFFESRNFLLKSLGIKFLTRISVSRRVSDFIIRHPFLRVWMGLTDNWQIVPKIYVTTDICLGFYWQMAKDLYFLQHPFMRLFNSVFPLFW